MTAPLLYTYDEAVERLGGAVTANWLRRQVIARAIPHRRLGPKTVRFTEADLLAIVEGAGYAPSAPRPALVGQRRRSA